MSEEIKNDATETEAPAAEATVENPTPVEGGVEDVAVTAEVEVTPADQPELPDAVKQENELIRQSVEALTNLSNFR